MSVGLTHKLWLMGSLKLMSSASSGTRRSNGIFLGEDGFIVDLGEVGSFDHSAGVLGTEGAVGGAGSFEIFDINTMIEFTCGKGEPIVLVLARMRSPRKIAANTTANIGVA